MKRVVRIVAVLLGVVIIGLAWLRAVQLENVLPLHSDDVGYINFQHTNLSNPQIDKGLAEAGEKNHLEIYQLSGTTGTREVSIISRGENQPSEKRTVSWFRFNKTGSVSPAAAHPDAPRSGIYALKGGEAERAELTKWLNKIGAINTWEHFTTFQTYFLPLAYQGVIMILAVAILLVTATLFTWFIARAPSRIVRLSAGHSKVRIVLEDSYALLILFVAPAAATLAILLGVFGILKGGLMWQLLPPVVILFLFAMSLLAIAVTFISFLTFPRISHWVERQPLVSAFSGVSTVMCAFAMILSLSAMPLAYRSLLISTENSEAAQQASQLPPYYSLSFGGIVEVSRDYEAFVQPFANLVNQLESAGNVAVFSQKNVCEANSHVSDKDSQTLCEQGFHSLVMVNQKALRDLQRLNNGCRIKNQPTHTLNQQIIEFTAKTYMLLPAVVPNLKYYTCEGENHTIAVQHQGIFSLARNPLIIEIPSLLAAVDSSTISSIATSGRIVFTDPKSVVLPASAFGLNLSTDSTADTISVYSEDQNLGYTINLISLAFLFATLLLTVLTSAQIHALSKIQKTFPRYLAGVSVFKLIRARVIADFIFIAIGLGISLLLYFLLGIQIPVVITTLACIGIGFATITIRQIVMRQSLVNVCQRRS